MSKRKRTYEWDDPAPHIRQGLTMSGLDYMTAFIQGDIPNAPIARTLGFEGHSIEEGRVVFVGEPNEFVLNPIGTVHGGFLATMLDSALACAIHTTLEQGMLYTTLQLNINYTRAVHLNTGKLYCEATVIHRGRQMATSEATVKDEAGKIYAHGTTTCMIFPIPTE